MKTAFDLPGAAPIMAATIIGRVIGQVRDGFHTDPQLVDELCVYKAIQRRFPDDTVTMPNMFKDMVRRASTEKTDLPMDNLTEEQKKLWEGDSSEREKLLASMPKLTSLFQQAEPDFERWDDLTAIAQWSLLYAVETKLPGKISLYKSWIVKDEAQNRTNTNATRLLKEAEAAVKPLHTYITKFLKDVKADLEAEAEKGTAVPKRIAA